VTQHRQSLLHEKATPGNHVRHRCLALRVDERNNFWTWKRVSADGHKVAESSYTFASFNVCVLDAERAGYSDTGSVRRVRDHVRERPDPFDAAPERRRRSRKLVPGTDPSGGT